MKKILIVIWLWILLLTLSFVGFIGFMVYIDSQNITNNDWVDQKYFKKVETIKENEGIYKNLWEFEVSHFEEKSVNEKIGNFSVFYPNVMETSDEKFPVIIMVNGTYTPASLYFPILEHLSSWWFVVIGNEDNLSGSWEATSLTLDYILNLNSHQDSIFYNKIDETKIGVFGHSQWWAGAINAVTKFQNSGKFASLYTASAASLDMARNNHWDYKIENIKIPYFMTAGTLKSDAWMIATKKSLNENFEKISSNKITIMARRKNIWHKDILEFADSYATAWFLLTLKDDENAKKIFLWEKPEIQNNPNWVDVKIKNEQL